MARPRDDTFPLDERIFRGLKPDWVHNDQVLPEAIELPESSVGRSRYGARESVMDERRTGVGESTVGTLPLGRTWADAHAKDWQLTLIDWPEEGDHHAHMRVQPVVGPFEGLKPSGKQQRQAIRGDIAAAFRVVIPPTR